MITAIMAGLSAISSPITAWVKGRAEVKRIDTHFKAKVKEAKVDAQIKRIQQGDTAASELDMVSLQTRGYKDELLLVITVSPMVLVFFPGMVSYIEAGFEVLSTTPEWYLYAVLAVYIDGLGMRRLFRDILGAWVGKKFNGNK